MRVRATIVIPARLSSTRLEKKLLREIEGESVLMRTIRNCFLTDPVRVVVLTDSKEIMDHVNNMVECYLTPEVNSGTERICTFLDRIETDIVINVQGDEPFVNPKDLDKMISLLEEVPGCVYTLDRIIHDDELRDRNCVKIHKETLHDVNFFTRSPIFNRICNKIRKHIGIYGFSKEILRSISSMSQTPNSKAESLEQITWIENGISVRSLTTPYKYISIDTEEDLKKAIQYARLQKMEDLHRYG